MNRQGHEETRFFVGTEIEHTPCYQHRTMFVVGVESVDQILWQIGEADRRSKLPITHVYFGANHSFPNPDSNDAETWRDWEHMVQALLDRNYWCTLDLDVKSVEGLLESGLVEHHKFIPMISVKLPYLNQLGYNATIKLDDRDFAATNAGVWCHSLHDLLDRNKFTSWDQYSQDKPVK